jgi:acyl CoA:acetate/3-ketoacid CoA transferase
MVDAVVEHAAQTQFYNRAYDVTIAGSRRAPVVPSSTGVPSKLERRIIARRAALELRPGASLNFGFGIPGGIFGVLAEPGNQIAADLWMSVEQGTHNGQMLDDALFGATRNADAIVPSIEQFDYYSGGGVDIAFLGMGEADSAGNVNVSHLGGNLIGPGGFVEIAQYAKKVVFCGTFDAQGTRLKWDADSRRLTVQQPGRVRKFVRQVGRITFSGDFARRSGQEVRYRPCPHRGRPRHRRRTRRPAFHGLPTRNHCCFTDAGFRFPVDVS